MFQQQALSGEGIENIKLGKLKPSVSDLGDNKLTSRDVNIFFGIFSPIRHNLHDYLGYSIDKFEDNIRFMEIMVFQEREEMVEYLAHCISMVAQIIFVNYHYQMMALE